MNEKKYYRLADGIPYLETRWGRVDANTPNHVLASILKACPALTGQIIEVGEDVEQPKAKVVIKKVQENGEAEEIKMVKPPTFTIQAKRPTKKATTKKAK
jgi:hypothetical protein